MIIWSIVFNTLDPNFYCSVMSTVLHTVIKRSAKDVRCIRIVVGISSICLWIGFLTTAVSFFSPPWITWEVARPVPNVGVVNVRVHIGKVIQLTSYLHVWSISIICRFFCNDLVHIRCMLLPCSRLGTICICIFFIRPINTFEQN